MKIQRIELHRSDMGWDIWNKKTDTRIRFVLKDRTLHVIFYGADSKKNYRQALTPFFWPFKKNGLSRISLWLRFKSIKDELYTQLRCARKNYDTICLCGFSLGAGTAIIAEPWIRSVFGCTKTIETFYDSPVKATFNYQYLVNLTKGDIASIWPFFTAWTEKNIVKSPYKWYQFKKKHFYLREVARNESLEVVK